VIAVAEQPKQNRIARCWKFLWSRNARWPFLILVGGGLVIGVGYCMEPRQDGAQLAQSEGCMICHAVDQTRMGPSFKDVAAKYAGDPDASMTLLAELRNGQGHIKVVASKSELQQIIAFVLAVR
jgi:cytochrome c551/c552